MPLPLPGSLLGSSKSILLLQTSCFRNWELITCLKAMTTKRGEVDHLQTRSGNTYEMVSCIMQKAARAQRSKGRACLGSSASTGLCHQDSLSLLHILPSTDQLCWTGSLCGVCRCCEGIDPTMFHLIFLAGKRECIALTY